MYAGNVGSGFNQQTLKSTYDKIQPLITKKPVLSDVPREIGAVTWIKPELVCVVKFNEWTSDERLRAPVFLGLRMDGNPDEVVREAPEKSPVSATAMKAEPETEKAHTALLPADAAEIMLPIEGRRLKFTNLKKVFYPADEIHQA